MADQSERSTYDSSDAEERKTASKEDDIVEYSFSSNVIRLDKRQVDHRKEHRNNKIQV